MVECDNIIRLMAYYLNLIVMGENDCDDNLITDN